MCSSLPPLFPRGSMCSTKSSPFMLSMTETIVLDGDEPYLVSKFDVIVFLDPSSEIDDQLFQYYTMACGVELNWLFVYCPSGENDGLHSLNTWIHYYLPKAAEKISENGKTPDGERTHITLEYFMTLNTTIFTTSFCLLLSPLAYGYTGENIRILGNLVSQGSIGENSFNVNEDSKVFMEMHSEQLVEITSNKCKEMLPTNEMIHKFPKFFQENIYGAGFKFIVGRMAPSHPVAARFAPGLVSMSESGRQRNLMATIAYYELVKGPESYEELIILPDEDYMRLSTQYFDEIDYSYTDKDACILSLAKMCKAMNEVFTTEIFTRDTPHVHYSDFETTHLLTDGEIHPNTNYRVFRKVYPDFIEKISQMGGFLETLNPVYDLYAGFALIEHITLGTSWSDLMSMSREKFNDRIIESL